MKMFAKTCSIFVLGLSFNALANQPVEPIQNIQSDALATEVPAASTTVTPAVADPAYAITIKSSTHPANEPEGLLIVDFRLNDSTNSNTTDWTYRLYCPNLTVRNITSGQPTGDLITVAEEDKNRFHGHSVLTQIASSVCNE